MQSFDVNLLMRQHLILNSVLPLLPLSTFPLGENIRITCLWGFWPKDMFGWAKSSKDKSFGCFPAWELSWKSADLRNVAKDAPTFPTPIIKRCSYARHLTWHDLQQSAQFTASRCVEHHVHWRRCCCSMFQELFSLFSRWSSLTFSMIISSCWQWSSPTAPVLHLAED